MKVSDLKEEKEMIEKRLRIVEKERDEDPEESIISVMEREDKIKMLEREIKQRNERIETVQHRRK